MEGSEKYDMTGGRVRCDSEMRSECRHDVCLWEMLAIIQENKATRQERMDNGQWLVIRYCSCLEKVQPAIGACPRLVSRIALSLLQRHSIHFIKHRPSNIQSRLLLPCWLLGRIFPATDPTPVVLSRICLKPHAMY